MEEVIVDHADGLDLTCLANAHTKLEKRQLASHLTGIFPGMFSVNIAT
jgi:hypothetical protein